MSKSEVWKAIGYKQQSHFVLKIVTLSKILKYTDKALIAIPSKDAF